MSTDRVAFVNLPLRIRDYEDELVDAFRKVLRSGAYIMGPEVAEFENALKGYCGVDHVLGVANGTDGLIIALRALNIGAGDEVITAPNSFIASAGAIQMTGAEVRFADVGPDYNLDPAKLEAAITERTKAIMPVHLTGRPAPMDEIKEIAKRHSLYVIEDAAQAIGAKYKGRPVGSLGDIASFSLHPLKNLQVFGDAGFLSTPCKHLYERMSGLRNHGLVDRNTSSEWGLNSRLDTIQAALGLVQLKRLDAWTEGFRSIAAQYRESLKDVVSVPEELNHEYSVYHNFVVLADRRDELMQYLDNKGIDTKIHYPILLHRQPAAKHLKLPEGSFPVAEDQVQRMVSLPIYPELEDSEIKRVIAEIRNFYSA
ncbi:dTDP-3-amino-3,6-dideoxy-alpha-D-galactopyranose transaminase [Labrenzia sp. THAF82]|uniref:DegT/DnrJ/EryC1/StrS family aminotransferase n=1 Tax=Labrenzia sp. THAF82 TaxID=2587861 RepID=UPI0012695061|nr:DegT/DnrJ/EryC1/StrS family aminotransferase [Labrenzia sp. THAF82]QFT34367.1 dTDP-3-amino-3,6-dideoxy-alpha-D-galactopyranose transaminase [Labrenzia sp. THAF82]